MADFESNEWLQQLIRTAACVDHDTVSADALGVLAETLPTLRSPVLRPALNAAARRTEANIYFLAGPAVPYDTAAKLFAAIKPASAKETIAFLCRSDMPAADVARIVASERRMTVLVAAAELTGRGPAMYEAVVSAFGKAMEKSSTGSGFPVLLALLTNPDVPLVSKATAAAVPPLHAWTNYLDGDGTAYACWWQLKSSELLQAAAFDGLSATDSMLLDCAEWQCLSTTQLRVVFAALQRQLVRERKPPSDDAASGARWLVRFTGDVDPDQLTADLLTICDHVAATDEFLAEVDDWFDKFPFPDSDDYRIDLFFWFTFRKHRRQGQLRVVPAEFWETHPKGPRETLTLFEWSHWTRLGSVAEVVEVLAAQQPDWWSNADTSAGCLLNGCWLAEPLTPLIASASSAELLGGLEAAAATGIPDVLAEIDALCWYAASYDALTFDVLRRLRRAQFASSTATLRLLELFTATLGPDPELWHVFDQVSAPDATIGEILDLAAQILDPNSP